MKTFKRNKGYIIVALTLIIFTMGVFYKTIFFGKAFAWYNDQLFQHNIFYKEWYRLIKECISTKSLTVYSWNTFLGTDYLTSKLMYCVGDYLITPFFIVWNGEINYDLLYAITTIITVAISGLTMLLYLKKFGIKDDNILVTISILYALGGFAMTYTGTYMFHRFYSLLPLLFYFCEKYIQDNKTVGFSIIVTILFFQSYELLFSTAFFLILYFIVSFKLKQDISLVNILKRSVRLIISFVIGILICGIVLIPLYLYIRSNPRVGGYSYDGLVWDLRTIAGFITNTFVPSFNFRSSNPNYLFYTSNHYSSEYGYFSTSLIVIAFIILLKGNNKKEKNILITSEILLIIFLLIKPLNSIIHGFSIPTLRWSFLLEFYHLMVMSYVFDNYKLDKKLIKEITIVYIAYIVLYVVFVVYYQINIKDYWISIVINITAPLLLYVYNFLLINNRKRVASSLTVIVTMIFYVLSIYATYGAYDSKTISYNKEYLSYINDTDEDLMSRYHFNSEDLWPYSWLNLNQSVENEYLSVSTYDSTYDSTLTEFLTKNGYDSWMISIDNPDIAKMLGVKYWVVANDEELPKDLDLEYYSSLDNLSVYKLTDYNNIGHTFSNFVVETDYDDFDYNNALSVSEEDYDLVSDIKVSDKSQLNVIEYNNQYLKGTIDVSNKEVLFVAIPYSNGWTVTDQSGEQLKTIKVDDGFLGVIIDENANVITFSYLTPGIKAGAIISILGVTLLIVEVIIDKRLKNN